MVLPKEESKIQKQALSIKIPETNPETPYSPSNKKVYPSYHKKPSLQ